MLLGKKCAGGGIVGCKGAKNPSVVPTVAVGNGLEDHLTEALTEFPYPFLVAGGAEMRALIGK